MGDGPKNDDDLRAEFASDSDRDSGEEVLVRRIDKRLARREATDLPWLRRIVGFSIIIAAFWYGWTLMDRNSAELIQRTKREAALSRTSPGNDPPPSAASLTVAPPIGREAVPVPEAAAILDMQSLTTISECTKGVNAFRGLDLNASVASSGQASLESIFKPVLISQKGRARRSIQMQNVRIRTKSGEELRLHAAPKTQGGDLFMSLFRVAKDGLPEAISFPPELSDLKDKKIGDAAVAKFLTLSETPGQALAVERHEAWSFSEKTGLQIISNNDLIYDLQAFMPNGFLACSRGARGGAVTVNCKCVERSQSK